MNTTSQGNPFLKHLDDDYVKVLQNIRARSIARFGFDAFRMEGDGDGGTGDGGDQGGDGGDSGAGDTGKKADQQDAGDKKAGDKGDSGKVEDLPDWAQRIIKDARSEAAQNRTGKSDAEKQLSKLMEGLIEVVGGKKGDAAPTPEQLATQLGETTTAHTELQREHQALLSALDAGADHKQLLDSRGFLAKLADLDPTAKDFVGKVDAAVKAALEDNPKLKAGQASGSSSADHAGGSGNGGAPRKPKSMADAVASTLGTS